MICTICGNEYHSASLGGPGICSFCDCYPANESKLRQENAKLRTELELLRGRPAVSGEPSRDVLGAVVDLQRAIDALTPDLRNDFGHLFPALAIAAAKLREYVRAVAPEGNA